MKKAILYIAACLLVQLPAFAQDLIFMRNGDTIKAKVLSLTADQIEYKKFSYLTGPTHVIPKSDVRIITYENGTSDTFSISSHGAYPSTNFDMRRQGDIDARRYYSGYTGAMIGSAASGLAVFYGIATPIACSLTPPKPNTLHFPDAQLMENGDYRHAYESRAYNIKKARSWEGYGIGLLTFIAVVMISSIHN